MRDSDGVHGGGPVQVRPSSRRQGTDSEAVTVRMFAAARAAAGAREVSVPAGPCDEVVRQLIAQLPPRFAEVLPLCSLMCDGVRLDPDDSAPVPPGATIDVLPPFAGG